MTTIATLEIGQHFTFFRKSSELVYMGYLKGEHHYIYAYATNDKAEDQTISNDVRVTILN